MKRIFSLFVAMFMLFGMANAQTIENHGVFSNMYIGLNGGAIHSTITNYDNFNFNTLNWNGALEIGENITPVTGISVEGIYNPKYNVNETELNRLDVFVNGKFNLMNLFAQYKGMPRVFEIQFKPGIGWNHYFGEYANPNDLALQAGLEFDFNLGKNKNWYITFTPMVQANEILTSAHIEPMVKNADLKANLGIAYRFGKGNGSHNFVICDKTYTDEQYADLYEKYDEAMNQSAKVDTVVIEKTVEVEKIVEVNTNNTVLTFAKNSSTITTTEMQRLDIFMANVDKNANIKVVGSADTKTGSEAYNINLATARAEAVKTILVKNGYKNVETSVSLDTFDTVELSRNAAVICE